MECSNSKCTKCFGGYLLSKGLCIPCSKNLHHCVECDVPDKCKVCDFHIANPDVATSKCTNCRTKMGWNLAASKDRCECKEIVDVVKGNMCKTCSELIPGCEEC